jgi:hypothetical protein
MDDNRIIIFVNVSGFGGSSIFHHLPYKRGPLRTWR